jgi:hypothetical protein
MNIISLQPPKKEDKKATIKMGIWGWYIGAADNGDVKWAKPRTVGLILINIGLLCLPIGSSCGPKRKPIQGKLNSSDVGGIDTSSLCLLGYGWFRALRYTCFWAPSHALWFWSFLSIMLTGYESEPPCLSIYLRIRWLSPIDEWSATD